MLSIYGHYAEAFAVAAKQRTTKIALGARLSLELDWLDAAGELDHDVEPEWQELLANENLNRIARRGRACCSEGAAT